MHVSADHVVELDPTPLVTLLGLHTDDAPSGLIARFEVVRLPDLPLPDGEVVAADGLIMQGYPYTRRLPAGATELRLIVAHYANDDHRIAFAVLGPKDARVERFEQALTVGQDLAELKPGHVFGYPVDTGTGSFASPGAHARLGREDDLHGIVEAAMKSVYRDTREWCTIATDDGSAALFSSGVGDGLYPSFFGIDAAGDAVLLVSDFSIADWSQGPA